MDFTLSKKHEMARALFREFAEKPCKALGHYVFVFVPEVEHVAQEIDGSSLLLDGIKKSHQPPLLHPSVWDSQRPEVGIR